MYNNLPPFSFPLFSTSSPSSSQSVVSMLQAQQVQPKEKGNKDANKNHNKDKVSKLSVYLRLAWLYVRI